MQRQTHKTRSNAARNIREKVSPGHKGHLTVEKRSVGVKLKQLDYNVLYFLVRKYEVAKEEVYYKVIANEFAKVIPRFSLSTKINKALGRLEKRNYIAHAVTLIGSKQHVPFAFLPTQEGIAYVNALIKQMEKDNPRKDQM